MTTVADLINQARVDYLQGGRPERRNLLANAITTTTATSAVLTYDTIGIAPNSRISIDLEDMHVYEVDPTNKTLTITRGDYGSTAATHAVDDVVLVGEMHSNNAILNAFNDVLAELSSRGLFRVPAPLELTYSTGTDGYDLAGTTDFIDVLEVESRAGSRTDWHRLDVGDWRVVQQAETDDFASGEALILTRGNVAHSGEQLRVWYRAAFGALDALTDDSNTDAGLPATAADLLPLGAAVRLSAAIPLLRNKLDYQPDPRRSDEVPAGATIAAPSNLRRIFERRVSEEIVRQDTRYPVRLRVT